MLNARWLVVAMVWAIVISLVPWTSHVVDVGAAQTPEIQPDTYEPDDTVDQSHPLLPVGLPQTHTFHAGNDVDWVYVELDAGERVSISTTGDCDAFMTLYAPDGRTPLAQDDDSGGRGNALIRFSAPVDGQYYVEVRQFGRSASACGPYQLSASIIPPPSPDRFEPDDSPGQAKPLPTNGTLQEHSIHTAGDQDWVSLTVEANTAFRIATTGNCDTVLTLFGPNGTTQLAEDDDSGQNGNSVLVYTFLQAGAYYVRARAFDEADVCDSYNLSATSVEPSFPDPYEPDDTPEEARILQLDGTPQQRSLHSPSDLDWVSFFMSPGDRVFIWTSGPCDTYLFIVASDGKTILDEDDDSGDDANAAVFFAPKTPGLFYAVVRPFGGSSPTCPSYQLQGLLVPPAQPRAGGPTATPPAGPSATPTATVRGGTPTAVAPRTPTPAPTRTSR